jgi:hypothetical protein
MMEHPGNHVLQSFPASLRLGEVNMRKRLACSPIETKSPMTKDLSSYTVMSNVS